MLPILEPYPACTRLPLEPAQGCFDFFLEPAPMPSRDAFGGAAKCSQRNRTNRVKTVLEPQGPERDAFEAWRAAYPARGWLGTGAAEAAWVKARKCGASVEEIMVGAAAWARSEKWLDLNIPVCAPAVWLNQARWKDAPPPAKCWTHIEPNAAAEVVAVIMENNN